VQLLSYLGIDSYDAAVGCERLDLADALLTSEIRRSPLENPHLKF
jgi:hypothetical protein